MTFSLANLQDMLASQIGIIASQQELYHDNAEFKPDPMSPILHYPEITVSILFIFYFLFSRGSKNGIV